MGSGGASSSSNPPHPPAAAENMVVDPQPGASSSGGGGGSGAVDSSSHAGPDVLENNGNEMVVESQTAGALAASIEGASSSSNPSPPPQPNTWSWWRFRAPSGREGAPPEVAGVQWIDGGRDGYLRKTYEDDDIDRLHRLVWGPEEDRYEQYVRLCNKSYDRDDDVEYDSETDTDDIKVCLQFLSWCPVPLFCYGPFPTLDILHSILVCCVVAGNVQI